MSLLNPSKENTPAHLWVPQKKIIHIQTLSLKWVFTIPPITTKHDRQQQISSQQILLTENATPAHFFFLNVKMKPGGISHPKIHKVKRNMLLGRWSFVVETSDRLQAADSIDPAFDFKGTIWRRELLITGRFIYLYLFDLPNAKCSSVPLGLLSWSVWTGNHCKQIQKSCK